MIKIEKLNTGKARDDDKTNINLEHHKGGKLSIFLGEYKENILTEELVSKTTTEKIKCEFFLSFLEYQAIVYLTHFIQSSNSHQKKRHKNYLFVDNTFFYR